ncbi:hypothetical protein BJ944DRAFT_245179 [Cunninghamella echinulata]|nr:hypothetical protein BJ944DRAFT_245179 [Cunninghamella echinulata]
MDIPINLNRPPVDQDTIYEEVLAAFKDDLSEAELLKLFIKYSYHMYVDDYATIQKKIRREDPWGKDSILDGEELTFIGVAQANNDGGPSSSGSEGVIQADEVGGD